MAVNRYYSSTAAATTLTSGISNSATTVPVAAVVGFPSSYPYTLVLDQGTASEELIEVTAAVGLSLTATRGVDGTSGVSHSSGASVKHAVSARDFSEPQTHIAASATVHGLTGTVVGTSDSQTLTNKTITAPAISNPTVTGGGSLAGTITGTPTFSQNVVFSGSPNFSGTPTIGDFTNATHTHESNAKGGATFKTVSVSSTGTGAVNQTVQGISSQTADLTQWKNNGGTTLAKVDISGVVTAVSFIDTTGPDRVSAISTAGTSVSHNTNTLISWSSAEWNVNTMWSAGDPSRVTFTRAGTYLITAAVKYTSNATGFRRFEIRKNAAGNVASGTLMFGIHIPAASTISTSLCGSRYIQFSAADYIELWTTQTSGGNLTLATDTCYLQACYVGV